MFSTLATSLFLMMSFNSEEDAPKKWEFLLDKKLSKWDVFIGVLHHSLNLEVYENVDDKMEHQ